MAMAMAPPYWTLLDALVGDRGRVAAAEALGVNYRTMMTCYDSRRVSRRMRQALMDFQDAGGADEVGGDVDTGAQVGDGEGGAEDQDDPLHRRMAALESENRELRELVESQAGQLEELGRRVAQLEQRPGDAPMVGVAGQEAEWRPPRRGRGMPDAGVVTLEVQPDEEHAFGPAAVLVAEWREVRARMQDDGSGDSRVERAAARVRRWELEAELLGDFHLTLPPDTEPLDEYRRADQVGRRREALVEARRKLAEAKRVRMLRRVLTLGLWRR